MRELLLECKLQLEYLNEKFGETGTTNALISKINNKLNDKELLDENLYKELEMSMHNFQHIVDLTYKLTSGNVSHQGSTILGIAKRNVDYLKNIINNK